MRMTQSQETSMPFTVWTQYIHILNAMKAPYMYDPSFRGLNSFKFYHPQCIYRAVFEGDSDVYALRTADRRIQAILDWLTPERVKVVRLKVKLGVVNG